MVLFPAIEKGKAGVRFPNINFIIIITIIKVILILEIIFKVDIIINTYVNLNRCEFYRGSS